MNKMSLRTKGLILMVVISLIPLLIAGIGNYSAVKDAMLRSEIEKISSRQDSQADNIAAWMDIRRAEVMVMSRTSVVRFGTNEERLNYLERELVRNGFTYFSLGFISEDGMAQRSDGPPADMSGEPFFRLAMEGRITITDPYKPAFSAEEQTFIVIPVYGIGSDIVGAIYGSIPFTAFNRFFDFAENDAPVRFYNDEGDLIYTSNSVKEQAASLKTDPALSAVASDMLKDNNGHVKVRADGESFFVFYSKIDGTPWRLALQEPYDDMKAMLTPIFWRIVTMITVSEIIIAVLFFIYFHRIVKRLERILNVTEQAAAGKFQAEHLDISPEDEIGQLAHSVNGMMEHLQEMFDQLSAIINQNQYGFIVLDDQYRVTYLNKAAEEMLGYKTEELVGHATPLLFMDPDEIAKEAELLSAELGKEVLPGLQVFKELRHRKFSYEREWTFIHKDGTRIPTLHSSNGLRDRNGRFSGVVGMVRNISETKQVENARNRLMDIVESAKDLIASVDMDGSVIYMNRAGKEMLGLNNSDEIGETLERYVDSHMYAHLLKGAELAKKFGFWESVAELTKLNGEVLHVSMVVVAHVDQATGDRFYSCIARDITEQKLVQEELVRATLEAEEANMAKSRFLALMSHEIRTPLNGIIGLTQLLRKTELSVVQKDYLNKMNMSSESLLRIINDVLDFSKIEAEKIELEQRPFRPEELLYRLANGLSFFLGGKEQFEFMIKTPDRLPVKLIGDSLRLEQVLLNLCMNAIKFTSHGMVKLELDVTWESEDRILLSFAVADTGIGMSQEVVDKLFKPFTQADSSTTRKFGGTGLGLVISQRLVALMGGTLQVSSQEGVGSRFFFTLPFEVAEKPAETPRDWLTAELPEDREGIIWVVEDDRKMRDHWSYMFETMGLTVLAYDSWETALERLRRVGAGALPQLLLMDMEMPDMYGIDTWNTFRAEADKAGARIIALTTTFGRDELQRLSAEERPLAILTKPATRGAIARALSEALRNRSLDGQHNGQQGQKSPSCKGNVTNVKILLAEDNKINQLVAVEMLNSNGYQVGLAENGQQVLDMLEKEAWDLILMDIHMPVMDGTEATRIIRCKPQFDRIPIIAVTANILQKDHEKYLRLGMNDTLTKPLSEEKLLDALSFWLDRLEAHPELGRTSYRSSAGGLAPAESLAAAEKLPQIPGMDVESALERVNGKKQILLHMIDQFRLDYTEFMDRLRMVLKQGDRETVARMLHTLKGAGGYLSAYELCDAANLVSEQLKRPDGEPKEMQLAIAHLEKELAKLLAGLHGARQKFDK
ncbi:response regulator [Paenibacillus nanensis]|uniref:Circadian input-output histidine kinase CikA n=1 Tax=Paenibacillus nanensis TaxID=393251 RepID=A0A3A1VIB0_9BACL|nr:response regulator [Paenibacillus nanensis]RIX60237.1 response regulator [Paenibacillus nanensis]